MTDPTAPETLRTQAGQRFDQAWPGSHIDRLDWQERILAIEREAGSTDALREALETIDGELRHYDLSDDPGYIRVPTERVRAVFVAALADSDAGPARCPWITSANGLSMRCALDSGHEGPHQPTRRNPRASDAGPAGIDVERVRQVLDSTKSCTDKCDHEGVEWTWSSVEAHAERFAAEYERLRRGVK
jgi:hypothetical protein